MTLDKLEKLTSKLPLVPSIRDFRIIDEGIIKYKLDKGEAISESIYSTEDIAIAKFFVPKGNTFPTHIHVNIDEWLIVLKGSLKLFVEGENVTLNRYDSIKINADKSHYAIAVEDSTIIAITAPRDDGFPE